MKQAVVLSAHVIGLGVVRALGEAGVPVTVCTYDDRDMGMASRYAREHIKLPHPEKQESNFTAALLELGKRWPDAILFPADDATVSAVARNRDLLSTAFRVACCDWAVVTKYISKEKTYELTRSLGVPTPWTELPKDRADAERLAREVEYPCLVKPCESHQFFDRFRRKMTRVERGDQLLKYYDEAVAAGLRVLVQELVPGGDDCGVNYNSLVIDGEPVVEFTAEKVRLSPPAFGVPRVVVSKRIPEILEPGRKVLRGLGFSGFACTEFKRDQRTGVYKFMEVNGRHNRSGMLAVRCGINFPLLEYEWLAYGRRPDAMQFREGVYWIDDLKDLVESFRHRSVERYSFRELIRPYLRQHVYAVMDWSDPGPMRKRFKDLALRARLGTGG